MCTELETSGSIRSDNVISAFRKVDRACFLPEELAAEAYVDRPVRFGSFHQSAIHIYASALESLELEVGNSFLNVGSGTGYFSTLVGACIGPHAINHGVELCEELVTHAQQRYSSFLQGLPEAERIEFGEIKFFHGNALEIQPIECMSYDRIYVGAGCTAEHQQLFQSLLNENGILFGPFENEMLVVRRLGPNNYSVDVGAGVSFLPLRTDVSAPICLPKRVWSPQIHKQYPPKFRSALKMILLVFNRVTTTAAGDLPKQTLLDIFSFLPYDWFEPQLSELEVVKKTLEQESQARKRAENELRTTKRKLRQAERERDIYLMLTRRMRMQLREIAEREEEEAAMASDENCDVDMPPAPPTAAGLGQDNPHEQNASSSIAAQALAATLIVEEVVLGLNPHVIEEVDEEEHDGNQDDWDVFGGDEPTFA